MLRERVILITGAVGEIGQALVKKLSNSTANRILSLDLKPLPDYLAGATTHISGDILDQALLSRIISEYEIETIYHLAALLSTRAEFTPEMAHRVNVEGTMGLLQLAAEQSERLDRSVRFIFPSSVAAFGLPDLRTKERDRRVKEWEWNSPTTMYGCNKLYCEMMGTYYSTHYQQLAAKRPTMVDFRAVRFPGLISAFTVPSGGTSDFASEMLHAAAEGKRYHCFVRPDTRIPFMAMPDAVTALLGLSDSPAANLRRRVYNVTSFSPTAEEVRELVLKAFPEAEVDFVPDMKRQGIVDSWPADLDDSAAREDWGWQPAYDLERAFNDYLVPSITRRYITQ